MVVVIETSADADTAADEDQIVALDEVQHIVADDTLECASAAGGADTQELVDTEAQDNSLAFRSLEQVGHGISIGGPFCS